MRLALPLREPFVTSGGVVSSREIALLRLEDDDGVTGHGEAAPLEPYDGVRMADVVAALEDGVRDAPPQAAAAEEMARLDLEARREGRPVADSGAEVIAVNHTLGGGPPEEVAARARDAIRAGFSCLKLKVGLPDDADRVAAVREAAGDWPALRLDANGAWSPEEAIETIAALAAHDLQLVEQPCASLDELARVRAQGPEVPIAADESVRCADDVRAAARARACDVVNVKLAGAGGVSRARAAIHAARDEGLGVFLSSTLDGPWGIAAALQLAASERITMACGLATLDLFEARIAKALPPPRGGVLTVPVGPGLGVDPDPDALDEVLVERIET